MDGGIKILQGDHQPSLLTSICNNGGYRKQIQKLIRNTTVPVSIVSIVFLKLQTKNGLDTDGGIKILWGNYRPSLLNSI